MKHRLCLLSTTALCVSAAFILAVSTAQAFDPNEGAAPATLPSTTTLTAPTETRSSIAFPQMGSRAAARPPIVFEPAPASSAAAATVPAPVMFPQPGGNAVPQFAPIVLMPQQAVSTPPSSVVFPTVASKPAVPLPIPAPQPVQVAAPAITPPLAKTAATPAVDAVPSTGFIAPVPPMAVAAAPAPAAVSAPEVVPAPISAVPPMVASMPELPPVDPVVAAKAAQAQESLREAETRLARPEVKPAVPPLALAPETKIAALPMVAPKVLPTPQPLVKPAMTQVAASSYIAPVPVIAPVPETSPVPSTVLETPNPVTVAPLVVPSVNTPAPVVTPVPTTVVESPAPEQLTRETKTVLSRIPSKMDAPKASKAGKLALNRTAPSVKPLDLKAGKVDAYEATGIKISVRRPGLDTNYELNRAFNALTGGDTDTAIAVYKDILSMEPKNQDALFGLAAIYHRQGQLDKARPLYAELLKVNPNHREGISNFLALVSEESPEESLAELERLEQRNPDFSPIPAQQAIVLSKLGFVHEARNKMLRAIELAPTNLTYKYNLAIMLDRQGATEEAAELYRLLIDAASKGAAIPTSAAALQSRLNYISSADTAAKTAIVR